MISLIESAILALAGARTRRPQAVRALPPAENEAGLVIGRTVPAGDASATPVQLTEANLERPIYLVGGSGAGKTTFLMNIFSHLLTGKTTVMIDLRGDLLNRGLLATAHQLGPKAANQLYVFDISRPDLLPPFNMLSSATGVADPYTRGANALQVLREASSSWGTTIEECGRHTLTALAFGDLSLADAHALLTSPEARARILSTCQDDVCRRWFEEFGALKPARQHDLSYPFLNKIGHLLVRPEIRRWLGSPQSVSMGDALNRDEGAVILIGLGADIVSPHVARIIGGMLMATITQVLLARSAIPEADRRPARIIADEFQNFASIDSFTTLLAEGRRYKAACFVAHQYASQIGPELRQAIVGNAATQAYFQTDAAQATALLPNVSGAWPAEEVRRILVGQPAGHCLLVRRGEAPLHVKVRDYRDPGVSEGDVERLRQAAFARFARPAPARDGRPEARYEDDRKAEGEDKCKNRQEVIHVQQPDIE